MIDGCNDNFCTRLTSSHRRTTTKEDIFPSITPTSLWDCELQKGDTSTTNANFSKAGTTFSTFSTADRPCLPHLSHNYAGDGDQEKTTLKSANSSLLTLTYWNGGGCMLSRLSVNPELKLLLSTQPDIFVYAENLLFSKRGLTRSPILQRYDCYHLTAVKNTCRRGLSVYYLKKHRFVLG